jgi:bifunctional UDP-N-acetylglucosamine pyrophosphorylase/glucosamine-1-phosphate N-acetyltransferase
MPMARRRTWCDGQDVEIDVGCIFTGQVEIGAGARIGAHCHISNAVIAADAVIHPFTHIDGEAAVPAWALGR